MTRIFKATVFNHKCDRSELVCDFYVVAVSKLVHGYNKPIQKRSVDSKIVSDFASLGLSSRKPVSLLSTQT